MVRRRWGARILSATAAVCAIGGCASPWECYEDSLYTALKTPQARIYQEHAELLGAIVDEFQSSGRTPPPGVLAEYGFYLARTGRPGEAHRYFAAEMQAYPESAVFVASLERMTEGRRAFQPADGGGGGRDTKP